MNGSDKVFNSSPTLDFLIDNFTIGLMLIYDPEDVNKEITEIVKTALEELKAALSAQDKEGKKLVKQKVLALFINHPTHINPSFIRTYFEGVSHLQGETKSFKGLLKLAHLRHQPEVEIIDL